jgi:hypothetical protein
MCSRSVNPKNRKLHTSDLPRVANSPYFTPEAVFSLPAVTSAQGAEASTRVLYKDWQDRVISTQKQIRSTGLPSEDRLRKLCDIPSEMFGIIRERITYLCHDIFLLTVIDKQPAVLIARRIETKGGNELGFVGGGSFVDRRKLRGLKFPCAINHHAPFNGVFWIPGGRVRLPLSIQESALSKLRSEVGLNPLDCLTLNDLGTSTYDQSSHALYHFEGKRQGGGTYSFELPVIGASQHTINQLLVAQLPVHAAQSLTLSGLDNSVWVTPADMKRVRPMLVPFMREALDTIFKGFNLSKFSAVKHEQ